jgi:hypothetical protein
MIALRKAPVAASRSAEEALYAAETARPGSVLDLVLAPGQVLWVEVPPIPGNHSRRKPRQIVQLVEDEEALCLVPPAGWPLRATLADPSPAPMADLVVTLPRDVALAVLHPARGVLSLRPGSENPVLSIEEL